MKENAILNDTDRFVLVLQTTGSNIRHGASLVF